MAEWGRKEYSKAWPSRTPVWTWTAILLSFAFLAGMLTLEYEGSWTAAERLYLSDYLKSGARGKASATAQCHSSPMSARLTGRASSSTPLARPSAVWTSSFRTPADHHRVTSPRPGSSSTSKRSS